MWQLLDRLWLWSPESSLSILLKVLGAWSSPRGKYSHCWQLPQAHLSLCWHLHILTASARTEICSPLSLLKGWLLSSAYTALAAVFDSRLHPLTPLASFTSDIVLHSLVKAHCCHLQRISPRISGVWRALSCFATHKVFSCFSVFLWPCQWNLRRKLELKSWSQCVFLTQASNHLFQTLAHESWQPIYRVLGEGVWQSVLWQSHWAWFTEETMKLRWRENKSWYFTGLGIRKL